MIFSLDLHRSWRMKKLLPFFAWASAKASGNSQGRFAVLETRMQRKQVVRLSEGVKRNRIPPGIFMLHWNRCLKVWLIHIIKPITKKSKWTPNQADSWILTQTNSSVGKHGQQWKVTEDRWFPGNTGSAVISGTHREATEREIPGEMERESAGGNIPGQRWLIIRKETLDFSYDPIKNRQESSNKNIKRFLLEDVLLGDSSLVFVEAQHEQLFLQSELVPQTEATAGPEPPGSTRSTKTNEFIKGIREWNHFTRTCVQHGFIVKLVIKTWIWPMPHQNVQLCWNKVQIEITLPWESSLLLTDCNMKSCESWKPFYPNYTSEARVQRMSFTSFTVQSVAPPILMK